MLRHPKGVLDRNRSLSAPRSQWSRKIDAHHRVVDPWLYCRAVHPDFAERVAPLESAHTPSGVGGEKRRAFTRPAIQILIRLQPHIAQSIRGIVGIGDLDRTRHF